LTFDFWFFFNQPIFPEVIPGYSAFSKDFGIAEARFFFQTDALPVAKSTASKQ